MSILSGRYGEVWYDATGVGTGPGLKKVAALNNFKADFKTGKSDVTCFGNTNKVYVPGLPDISGSLAGFWDSTELSLFNAAKQPTPGFLKLVPNNTEATFYWSGQAYMDASIDTAVEGAPKVTGTFMAANSWTGPTNP